MESLAELIEQKAALEQKIETLRAAERENAIAQIRGLMQQFNLKCDDIAGKKARPRAASAPRTRASVGEPKYQDPATGQTWTGKGRTPKWFDKDLEASFLIQAPPVAATAQMSAPALVQ